MAVILAMSQSVNCEDINIKDITEGSLVWDFLITLNGTNLVHCLDVRRQTTMYT